MRRAAFFFLLPLAACAATDDEPAPLGEECQIAEDQEHGPGWPYDLQMYETQVLPALVANCSAAGCHGAPVGNGNFTVWADAAPGNCGFGQTFNSLAATIDLATPANSRIVTSIDGTLATHPVKLGAQDATTLLLLDYATRASQTAGVNVPPPPASPFDYNVYQDQIQPILDGAEGKGCAAAGCHSAGVGGFTLLATPARNSADMASNFTAVTTRCDIVSPESSRFYINATTRHGFGASAVVTPAEAQVILAWIAAAEDNGGPQGGNCPPTAAFNVGVFRDEIQPILFGDVGGTTGCALSACHGADRAGGALVLKESWTAEQNLQNFVCFVDLTHPVQSEILACPLDQEPCRRRPHPGQDVFSGADEPNFQKILSYLYAAKTDSTPLDFAFYARVINPILNDVNSVEDGAQNRTCADTVSCHGVSAAGQAAPNGSNFPIIANLSDEGSLAFNFSSAANFTNFSTPDGSSLFLYPTNEIANLENPFATGLPHPGGLDFAPDSREALAILTWARGLRPDDEGYIKFWLVAGDYSATLITSPTLIDEINARPAIFDSSGAPQFNNGQWDALISEEDVIDLNAEFPRAETSGRVAYATAYVLNTAPYDIEGQITVTSNNSLRVWVDEQPVLQADSAPAGVTGLAVLPAFTNSKSVTRLFVKVLQRSTDEDFSFSVRLSDQFGNVLSDQTGEIVVKLGPEGGI